MQRTFKYRLYPNRKQRETLAAQLELCRELYNAALQERIESYKTTRKGVTWLQQQSQLPAVAAKQSPCCKRFTSMSRISEKIFSTRKPSNLCRGMESSQ